MYAAFFALSFKHIAQSVAKVDLGFVLVFWHGVIGLFFCERLREARS